MSFNYLYNRLVPNFNNNYNKHGFYILVTKGNFKTVKYKEGYNYYTTKYEMFIFDEYIKFSKFYNPSKLSKALKVDESYLELFYKK